MPVLRMTTSSIQPFLEDFTCLLGNMRSWEYFPRFCLLDESILMPMLPEENTPSTECSWPKNVTIVVVATNRLSAWNTPAVAQSLHICLTSLSPQNNTLNSMLLLSPFTNKNTVSKGSWIICPKSPSKKRRGARFKPRLKRGRGTTAH